ncbi:hypothetical protein F5Y10DRAFT_238877 [Nemania abortiva]|nr:hypothetical protein F5Y10DRAFT_238877 [Nemania abortiva]
MCQGSRRISTAMETTIQCVPSSLKVAPKAEKSLCEDNCGMYPCTFCNRTFKKKGFWVQHEVTLHEPQKQWSCPAIGCNRIFSTGNKFNQHHKRDHGCEACTHDKDPDCIVRPSVKSAWGCGFCIAFLESWETRVNHLETHFRNGSKRAEWDLSKVIQGLLLRSSVNRAWRSLMAQQYGPLEQEWPVPKWPRDSFEKLWMALRYDMSEESALQVARLTYDMLSPLEPEGGRLAEAANSPIGNIHSMATDESAFRVECLFDTSDTSHNLESTNDSIQNFYPDPDAASAETAGSTGGYSELQLGEDTLGVDWVLWPDHYGPGGTIMCAP